MNGKDVRRGDFLDLLEAILEAATDSAQLGDALTQALGQEFRQPGFSLAAALESLRSHRAHNDVGLPSEEQPQLLITIRDGDEAYYRATVELFIAAEWDGEACDLVSALLTENGIYGPDNMLRDWMYLAPPWQVFGVSPDVAGREQYFAAGAPELLGVPSADNPVGVPIFRHRPVDGETTSVPVAVRQ